MENTSNKSKKSKARVVLVRGLEYSFCLLLFVSRLCIADCTIDANHIDRGERKEFIICGENIPSDYVLTGLSEAHITLEYHQYLSCCSVGSMEAGIFMIIKAEDDATTASLLISDAEGTAVCDSLIIEVPDRVHIQDASFIGQTYPTRLNLPYLWVAIKSTANIDLSYACEQGLSFPKGKWPVLSQVSMDEIRTNVPDAMSLNTPDHLLMCSKSFIRALVKVQGEQRYPAKIIISKVILEGGIEKEGVTYATLPPPPWLSDMEDKDAKYVDVNGIRTRYFEKGKGEALVLVHGGQAGGCANAQNWEQNFKYLSKYFHVYALDKIGSAYTGNPKTDEDWDNYYTLVVEHIYEFMKTVSIKKAHLIGQSQGGWPVTRIALDHPEMVLSVVNMDSGMAPDEYLMDTLPWMFYMAAFIIPAEGNPSLQSIRKGIELWSYSLNNITEEMIQRDYEIAKLPKVIEAKEEMEKRNMNPAHPTWVALKQKALDEIREGKLRVPSLVIWGHDDPAMPYESGVALYELISSGSDIPGSQLAVFDECGHSPYIEYPELFNTLIKHFCGAFSLPPIH